MSKQLSNKSGKQKAAVTDNPHSSTPSFSNHNHNHNPPLSTPPMSQSGTPKPDALKVAIPRLPRQQRENHSKSKAGAAADKNRVAHACEPCRHRKTKCSGERPVCGHCQDFNLICIYADGKRDRTKKQLGSLARRVEDYERLLEDLSLRVGAQDQELIRKTMDNEQSSDDDDLQIIASPRGRRKESRGSHETPGEEKVSARVGSVESMDRISEDFNRGPDTRATGFHGKNSEVTWMQRLRQQAASHSSEDSDDSEEGMVDGVTSQPSEDHHARAGYVPISASSYHCDDLDVLLHEDINPYDVPSLAAANALFESYLNTVHPSFPIIGKNTFAHQFNAFIRHPSVRRPNQNWLAILNMIFALGAKYLHLIGAEGAGNARDHLVYFTRARMLGFNADAVLGHAELQKIQITGLMAFYLMAINQINRSWAISGIAIRHAATLGLNLRNETKDVPDGSKEIRYRVWWALCSVERLLAVMTGRPTSFAENDCTAPLPLPIEEDTFLGSGAPSAQTLQLLRRWSSQESGESEYAMTAASNESPQKKASPSSSLSPAAVQQAAQSQKQPFPPCNSLAFGYMTMLSTLTVEVLDHLYLAAGMSATWAHVQTTITDLNAKLEGWRQKLPPIFCFDKQQQDEQFVSQRMNLGFMYYTTLIIINRPCLCRVDRKIPDESTQAKIFDQETAVRCVHAARGMLDLLPDEPNAIGLYSTAPWWCLTHWLMQAATVSMLELSFRADHMPNEVEEVFKSAKKALAWLRDMSKNNEAARRASVMCNQLLREVARKVGKSPQEASTSEPEGEIQSVDQMQNSQDPDHVQQSSEESDGYVPLTDGLNPEQRTQLSFQIEQAGYPPPSQYHPQIQQQYGQFCTTAAFPTQMFTSYDQMGSFGQMPPTSSSVPFENLFPTDMEMEGLTFDDHEPADYFNGQDQNWFVGSSSGV